MRVISNTISSTIPHNVSNTISSTILGSTATIMSNFIMNVIQEISATHLRFARQLRHPPDSFRAILVMKSFFLFFLDMNAEIGILEIEIRLARKCISSYTNVHKHAHTIIRVIVKIILVE